VRGVRCTVWSGEVDIYAPCANFEIGACGPRAVSLRQVLAFPRFSLAYQLKHYCDIDADKQYQVADWRTRRCQRR
jgi:hypothetical protein